MSTTVRTPRRRFYKIHSPSGIELLLPANMAEKITQVAIASSDGAAETTKTAARVTEFNVVYYHHENLPFGTNQSNNPDAPLHNKSDGNLFSLVQSFLMNEFAHTRSIYSVTATATATRAEACEGASSSAFCILDEDPSMAILDRTHWLYVPPDILDIADIARNEAPLMVRCATQHGGHPMAQTEALKLSNLATMVASIVRHSTSFVTLVQSVMGIGVAIKKEHGVSYLLPGWGILSRTWFRTTSGPAMALRHSRTISGCQNCSIQALIISI